MCKPCYLLTSFIVYCFGFLGILICFYGVFTLSIIGVLGFCMYMAAIIVSAECTDKINPYEHN